MSKHIETDYLVVGAGASGMAITDELLTFSDATLTIVDRRSAPGGHWRDAYSYVRLHQPSTFYGVSSMPLGDDAVDEAGTNAGFYELAGADELRAYYERVMVRRFLPSGRVRYFPNSDWVEPDHFVSRLTGETTKVKVARRIIDATYTEGAIPATSPPPFEVDDDAWCVPAGDIAQLDRAPERWVIVGGGKTALDACVHLIERGVSPAAIRWIKPREGLWMNRKFQQPLGLLPELYRGAAMQIEAMATAKTKDEIFTRLEEQDFFLRIDPEVPSTMLRGAVVSEPELEMLRRIDDVVRLGHVKRIGRDEIELERGSVPTSPDTVHVHCASRGLGHPPLRPIFEPGRLHVQPVQWSFSCYQYAMLGVVEATIDDDDAKNALCRPIHYWDTDLDYLRAFMRTMTIDRAAREHPELSRWMKTTRLNPTSGLAACADDPVARDARGRIKASAVAAAKNVARLLAD